MNFVWGTIDLGWILTIGLGLCVPGLLGWARSKARSK